MTLNTPIAAQAPSIPSQRTRSSQGAICRNVASSSARPSGNCPKPSRIGRNPASPIVRPATTAARSADRAGAPEPAALAYRTSCAIPNATAACARIAAAQKNEPGTNSQKISSDRPMMPVNSSRSARVSDGFVRISRAIPASRSRLTANARSQPSYVTVVVSLRPPARSLATTASATSTTSAAGHRRTTIRASIAERRFRSARPLLRQRFQRRVDALELVRRDGSVRGEA